MSVSQLRFFRHSAAASLASLNNNKDTMSHPSLLFHLTCESIKHMAYVIKLNQLQEKLENYIWALELGEWNVLEPTQKRT